MISKKIIWRTLTKKAGSGSGPVGQTNVDPDPYQNVTYLQHWNKGIINPIPSFADEFPRKLRRGPLEAIFAGIRRRPPLPAFSSSEESESDSRRPPLHHKNCFIV